MRLFHRQLSQASASQNADTIAPEAIPHQRSEAHLHPNYRHWSWFKPHCLDRSEQR